jgi:hypothetical protein
LAADSLGAGDIGFQPVAYNQSFAWGSAQALQGNPIHFRGGLSDDDW